MKEQLKELSSLLVNPLPRFLMSEAGMFQSNQLFKGTPFNSPEAEFLIEKPGTKTGLLPGFFVFSSRHLLSSNARYFWSFASFSSRFLQFVLFSSCFEERTWVSFSSRFVKSGYCFQVSDLEKVTTSSKKKTVTTFSRDQKSRL
jgi:hypothetical protein